MRCAMTFGRPLALGALLVAAPASADTPPSIWDRARDPEATTAYDLHAAVQQRLIPTLSQGVNDAAVRMVLETLKSNGAETSKNPLLRFDLAFVYTRLQNHARAAEIYKAAISEFPNHPAVERAWLRLAFACGHIADHTCERNAYFEVLRFETEEIFRATPTLNLAETQMHLGELKDAMEGYREALRIAGRMPTRETAPLATWGLAVALDRSGDRIGAEKEARFALEIERSLGMTGLLRSEDVFFVPDYEVHWYEGLGSAARARASTSSREAITLWKAAEKSFGEWVKGAEPKKDQYLPIAKARLAQIKAERERAEKATPREPPPPAEPRDSIKL
jgi:tetratricopeptide (TPR) repeat protein